MKAKAITVVPSAEVSEKIDQLAQRLRTTRAGFCNIAIEFVLPLVVAGEMAVVNGELKFIKDNHHA